MMPDPNSHAGGPFGPEEQIMQTTSTQFSLTAHYIERPADAEAVQIVCNMQYLLLIEPRQQGKTSLLLHLSANLPGTIFAYADVHTLERSSEIKWYETLCRRLQKTLPTMPILTVAHTAAEFMDFLQGMGKFLHGEGRRCVVVLDEIGAAKFPESSSFFGVLRALLAYRHTEPDLRYITFALAGACNPRELITDDSVSPFNVAQRVRLYDFTPEEAGKLLMAIRPHAAVSDEVARRIHFWTNGQPFLTTLICNRLKERDATTADVDAAAEFVRRQNAGELFPSKKLRQKPELVEYLRRIYGGERITFCPDWEWQEMLLLYGLIRADGDGHCTLRNEMTRVFVRDAFVGETPSSPPGPGGPLKPPPRDKVFISYSHKDKRWFDELSIHLEPYLRDDSVTVWSDEQIAPGAKWFADIEAAIATTKVAVFLVTPNFVVSEFIRKHELGPLLKGAEVNGVRIFWVPVLASAYETTGLEERQAVIDPKRPLASINKAERAAKWVQICARIKEAVKPAQ